MSLLVISPDYASHYSPLAVLAGAARATGARVVVATGPGLRARVEHDGFEWMPLRLGASSNAGVAGDSPEIEAFLAATRAGPLATIRHQALARQHDLLWEPERVAGEVAALCDRLDPAEVLVDHVSFGSTLAMHATGRSFVTLVPGHPSQLPVGDERYGIPAVWPALLTPDPNELDDVRHLADLVTTAFTQRWNAALAEIAPDRPPVEDAFRVHGRRVLYNSTVGLHHPARRVLLPHDHRFVGPLVREEELPESLHPWNQRTSDRPQVYVALGTFLSRRGDLLVRIADALRTVGARAAIALGGTPRGDIGPVPEDWATATSLPQVAMMGAADLVVHHGGNNSVQEALAAGARQLVLPMSTDQFANAADLERTGAAGIAAANDVTAAELADRVAQLLAEPRPQALDPLDQCGLASALFGCAT